MFIGLLGLLGYVTHLRQFAEERLAQHLAVERQQFVAAVDGAVARPPATQTLCLTQAIRRAAPLENVETLSRAPALALTLTLTLTVIGLVKGAERERRAARLVLPLIVIIDLCRNPVGGAQASGRTKERAHDRDGSKLPLRQSLS